MKYELSVIKAFIIIPCLLIGLFFSLRLGLFSYSSRAFNCSKVENNCKIISTYLFFDKEDVQSINISDIKKVVTEYDPNPKGFGHYALNIYTHDKKYTYLEAGSYYRKNFYNCSGIIANFLASKKQNLNLVYNISPFKSIMGMLISLCIIMSFILFFIFGFDLNRYSEIFHLNSSNGNGFLNILPISISMLLISILSTFIINTSQIVNEQQAGIIVGLIYITILALISILAIYQVFFPDKLSEFLKRKEILSLCSFALTILIILMILIVLIYGFGIVSLYMC